MTESQSSQNRKSDKPSWQKSIDLPSERGASRLIMDELLDKLGEHGWASADIFSIHLAAEEAIVNAIVHGNKLDKGKKYTLHALSHPPLHALKSQMKATDLTRLMSRTALRTTGLKSRMGVASC